MTSPRFRISPATVMIAVVTAGAASALSLYYWYQASFAVLVVVPLIARRIVKRRLDKGPRRTLWMKRCEAVAFAFLNMVLVLIGAGVQLLFLNLVGYVLKF